MYINLFNEPVTFTHCFLSQTLKKNALLVKFKICNDHHAHYNTVQRTCSCHTLIKVIVHCYCPVDASEIRSLSLVVGKTSLVNI